MIILCCRISTLRIRIWLSWLVQAHFVNLKCSGHFGHSDTFFVLRRLILRLLRMATTGENGCAVFHEACDFGVWRWILQVLKVMTSGSQQCCCRGRRRLFRSCSICCYCFFEAQATCSTLLLLFVFFVWATGGSKMSLNSCDEVLALRSCRAVWLWPGTFWRVCWSTFYHDDWLLCCESGCDCDRSRCWNEWLSGWMHSGELPDRRANTVAGRHVVPLASSATPCRCFTDRWWTELSHPHRFRIVLDLRWVSSRPQWACSPHCCRSCSRRRRVLRLLEHFFNILCFFIFLFNWFRYYFLPVRKSI